jgi:YidC/Oxa1 family membrane protein insertase
MSGSMNIIFPIMSVVFCFMFSAGIGLYWVASSGIQVLVQIFVNRYIDRIDLNDMVKKNIEKANVKRVKRGQEPIKVTKISENVRSLEDDKKQEEDYKKEVARRAQESTEYYASHSTAKKGSLAEKAGMVQAYEERQRELKSGKKN